MVRRRRVAGGFGSMATFDDLSRAVTAALETGKIGTPVAMRLYVRCADDSIDPAAVLNAAASLAGAIFSASPQNLTARFSEDRRQLNVLLGYADGQTLLLSVIGDVAGDGCDLLLIGNHGIVRLEGGELFDAVEPDSVSPDGETDRWQQLIAQSLATGEVIELDMGL